jgi:hypothetical protein
MSSVFIGRMVDGNFRAAVAKPGFDASDPATKIANMRWSSQAALVRRVGSGEVTVAGFNGVAGTGDGMGATTNVTIPEVVGTFFAMCQVQAVTRWSYVFHNGSVYSVALTTPDMATGWWMEPKASPSVAQGSWTGPRVELSLVNSTTLGIRTNNSGNGTNNTTRIRWVVFESRT